MMITPMIQIKNLPLKIDEKPILNSISFDIFTSDYISIIGPNGAGKTSLLKCLMKIYPFPPGSIFLNSKPLETYSQKELAKYISYVPQSDGRFFPFSVEEFVMMGRYPHLSPFTSYTRTDRQAVFDALELTHASHLAHRQINTLSGGERQTVFIAAALAQGAEILLLDEPTTFLDPRHEDEICRILQHINRKIGKTIITVTHNINHAALYSDRVVILKHGEILYNGKAHEIMTNKILEKAYNKSFLFTRHPVSQDTIIVPEVPA